MNKRQMIRNQLEDQMVLLQNTRSLSPPSAGWIYAIRYAINMSLRQLGDRMSLTPQSVKDMQNREQNGTISLRVLRQAAHALDMEFVYGFLPKEETLSAMIEKKAWELAEKIVHRTSIHMQLEDQGLSEVQLSRAIEAKAKELREEVPKLLWDQI